MKKFKLIFSCLLLFVTIFISGCGENSPSNNFSGLQAFLSNEYVLFYSNFGYFGAWVEYNGYLKCEENTIVCELYSTTYRNENKSSILNTEKLTVVYTNNAKKAGYKYIFYFGTGRYSQGTIDIDKYNGFISVVINEQISNLNSPPTAIINLHITVLKNYLAKNGFTLGALGYTNY